MEDKYKALIACFGISSITAIELVALSQGINGTSLSVIVAAIGGIVGAVVGIKLGEEK